MAYEEITKRGGRIHVMLRAACLLPQTGLATLRFNARRFHLTLGVCSGHPGVYPDRTRTGR
jgi:hypothetical protein